MLILSPLTSSPHSARWLTSFATGFYLVANLFPRPATVSPPQNLLLLGPFNGRPACQTIRTVAGKGVCADAFVKAETVVVRDVEEYPGHIG